ncbi:MAG: hypothetical protein ACREI2_12260 [Nitrospiraceae bacterium]
MENKDAGSTTVRDHLSGPAAYTRLNAMLSNTTEMAKAFYSS